MSPQERITSAIARHGLHRVTSELLKQAGEPYPTVWTMKTAALALTLKVAKNRLAERSIRQGLASLLKAST